MKRANHRGDLGRSYPAQAYFMVRAGRARPMPRVVKRGNLRFGFFTAFALEQDVVCPVGIEGRVKIDEVYAFVGYVFAQDGQIVAIEKRVIGDWPRHVPLPCVLKSPAERPLEGHIWKPLQVYGETSVY